MLWLNCMESILYYSKERPSIESYRLLVRQNKWSVLLLFFGTSKFLTKSNVPQKKRTERHPCLPLLDWPIAWFCASIPSQHHCSSLLSHSYWTGHRDWDLGMRCNMSYNMILCLATSLCSSLLSHSYWIVDIRIGLLVSSLLFIRSQSRMLDMRQPIGTNAVWRKVLKASLIQRGKRKSLRDKSQLESSIEKDSQ